MSRNDNRARRELERELPGAFDLDPLFRHLAKSNVYCICGYVTDSEDGLIDHISYMVAVVGDSNAKHRERR
jgi:hypothetical protein